MSMDVEFSSCSSEEYVDAIGRCFLIGLHFFFLTQTVGALWPVSKECL